MEEYTLADSTRHNASASGGPVGRRFRDLGSFRIDGNSPKVKMISRLVNGAARLGLCFVLLAIMTEFMVRYRGRSRRWAPISYAITVPSLRKRKRTCLILQYVLISASP